MKAIDVMTANVITVGPDTPVPELAKCLIDHDISAVPVVDAGGRMVGIVTEGDLIRRTELGTEKQRRRLAAFFTTDFRIEQEYIRAHGLRAADVMETRVVQVAPETPLTEIVDLFEANGIKRVPVIDQDRLVGIVSQSDLVRALACTGQADPAARSTDRRIRSRLLQELSHQRWGVRARNSIVVKNGVVHLWGLVDSPTEYRALRVAAQAIPGVRDICDHTIIASEMFPHGVAADPIGRRA